MSLEQQIDQTLQQTHIKMKQMSISMEKLEREFQDLLKELQLTPEEAKENLADPNNYSPPIWEVLQEHRKMLDEKLQLDLKNIRNPEISKKNYQERGSIRPHWIFVR